MASSSSPSIEAPPLPSASLSISSNNSSSASIAASLLKDSARTENDAAKDAAMARRNIIRERILSSSYNYTTNDCFSLNCAAEGKAQKFMLDNKRDRWYIRLWIISGFGSMIGAYGCHATYTSDTRRVWRIRNPQYLPYLLGGRVAGVLVVIAACARILFPAPIGYMAIAKDRAARQKEMDALGFEALTLAESVRLRHMAINGASAQTKNAGGGGGSANASKKNGSDSTATAAVTEEGAAAAMEDGEILPWTFTTIAEGGDESNIKKRVAVAYTMEEEEVFALEALKERIKAVVERKYEGEQ